MLDDYAHDAVLVAHVKAHLWLATTDAVWLKRSVTD